jgi:hypothetical protein
MEKNVSIPAARILLLSKGYNGFELISIFL